VEDSGNPYRTGVCCINMDGDVEDAKITAMFETAAELRQTVQRSLHPGRRIRTVTDQSKQKQDVYQEIKE
jgi:hypothetical protein